MSKNRIVAATTGTLAVALVVLAACEQAATGDTGGDESPIVAAGPNSCEFANDGECDEGTLCPSGTDTADCALVEPPTPTRAVPTVAEAEPVPLFDFHAGNKTHYLLEHGRVVAGDTPSGRSDWTDPFDFQWVEVGDEVHLRMTSSQPLAVVWAAPIAGPERGVWFARVIDPPSYEVAVRFRKAPAAGGALSIASAFRESVEPPSVALAFQNSGGGLWNGDCVLCPGQDPCWCSCCQQKWKPPGPGTCCV